MIPRIRIASLTVVLAALGSATMAGAGSAASSRETPTPRGRTRVFATLPNWTGLWATDTALMLDAGDFTPEPGSAADVPGIGADVMIIRAMRRTGLLMGKPPYNAQWERKRQAELAHWSAPKGLPVKACTGAGFPAVMDWPALASGLFEALVTPEETVLLFSDGEARHIYTDGRGHPKPEDLWPTPMGDSIGHWEENATLVIDTIARTPGLVMPLPAPGIPDFSSEAHFTERLRRIDANTMENDLTIDEPSRYAHAWHIPIRYKRVTTVDRMMITDCTENDRNPVVNGAVTTISPPR